MFTAKWILDAYEEGNNTVRWELYMTYRDLRPFFDEIEAEKDKQPRRAEKAAGERPSRIRWNLSNRLAKGLGTRA